MLKLGQALGTHAKPTAGFPIDEISVAPVGAWSRRKLASGYTGNPLNIIVGTEQADVVFDRNNEVSFTSLMSSAEASENGKTLRNFVKDNDGGLANVVTWYDQSGGTARNATQSTADDRPILVQGLELVEQKSLLFSDDYFKVLNYAFPNPDDSCTILAVARPTNSDAHGIVTDIENFNDGVELIYDSSSWDWRIKNTDLNNNPIDPNINGKLQLCIAVYDTSRNLQELYVNGKVVSQSCTENKHVASTDRFRIGARVTTNNQMDGNIAEAMIWDSALSSSDIEKLQNNIFSYYSIPKNSSG